MKNNANFISILISTAILVILAPFLSFWGGYFVGWLSKILIGKQLVNTLNSCFNTSFIPEQLPLFGGALGWISSFFKNITNTNNNK